MMLCPPRHLHRSLTGRPMSELGQTANSHPSRAMSASQPSSEARVGHSSICYDKLAATILPSSSWHRFRYGCELVGRRPGPAASNLASRRFGESMPGPQCAGPRRGRAKRPGKRPMLVKQTGMNVSEAASNPVRVGPAVRAGPRDAREAPARGRAHRLPAAPRPDGCGSRDDKRGPPASIKTLFASLARRAVAHRMLSLRVFAQCRVAASVVSPAHPTRGRTWSATLGSPLGPWLEAQAAASLPGADVCVACQTLTSLSTGSKSVSSLRDLSDATVRCRAWSACWMSMRL